MSLLLLEALGALVIFIGIVWWTMFSGRRGGELPTDAAPPPPDTTTPAEPAAPPPRTLS